MTVALAAVLTALFSSCACAPQQLALNVLSGMDIDVVRKDVVVTTLPVSAMVSLMNKSLKPAQVVRGRHTTQSQRQQTVPGHGEPPVAVPLFSACEAMSGNVTWIQAKALSMVCGHILVDGAPLVFCGLLCVLHGWHVGFHTGLVLCSSVCIGSSNGHS